MKMTLSSIWRHCLTLNGCYVWQGAKSSGGYPVAHPHDPARKKALQKSLRPVVWSLAARSPVPDGHRIAMKCNNRLCLKYGHMQLMTQAEYRQLARQRGAYQTGEAQASRLKASEARRRFSVAEEAEIREWLAVEGIRAVARLLRADRQALAAIRDGTYRRGPVLPNASVFNMRV